MVDDPRIKRLTEVEREKVIIGPWRGAGIVAAGGAILAAILGGAAVIGVPGLLLFGAAGVAMAYYGHSKFNALTQESLELQKSIMQSTGNKSSERAVSQDIEQPSMSFAARSPEASRTSGKDSRGR
ncbi:MAG: hypothetical protein KGI29_00930 [Pseudomonadota bacterium]|nr:hypothetical protein [Pseudomonadota bacterium]MDE3037232.1 hypothetical protein [Pseudomonadota bacterium]